MSEELCRVCAVGDIRRLKQMLLFGGLNINKGIDNTEGPMHAAAKNGRGSAVKTLLEFGADPNVKVACGWTPLHFAAANGKTEGIPYLKRFSADMGSRTDDGMTALHIAAKFGRRGVMSLLMRYIDSDELDHAGNTALDVALENGKINVVELLLRSGATRLAPDTRRRLKTLLRPFDVHVHGTTIHRLRTLSTAADKEDVGPVDDYRVSQLLDASLLDQLYLTPEPVTSPTFSLSPYHPHTGAVIAFPSDNHGSLLRRYRGRQAHTLHEQQQSQQQQQTTLAKARSPWAACVSPWPSHVWSVSSFDSPSVAVLLPSHEAVCTAARAIRTASLNVASVSVH